MIREQVADTSAQGIARTISGLISANMIKPGDQLPTVRSVAGTLGVSSSTISAAWRLMQNHGVISTDRRRGTTVRTSRGSIEGRYWQVPVPQGTLDIDLSTGTPDPELLPDIGIILHRLHAKVAVGSYLDAPVLPELEAELRRRWPFSPEHLTVVDGAQDALDRLIGALVQIGDAVVVEQPTFPPLLDMLELAGAEVIGVPLDHEGMQVDSLRTAVQANPRAVILQPRAHNPSGITMSADPSPGHRCAVRTRNLGHRRRPLWRRCRCCSRICLRTTARPQPADPFLLQISRAGPAHSRHRRGGSSHSPT